MDTSFLKGLTLMSGGTNTIMNIVYMNLVEFSIRQLEQLISFGIEYTKDKMKNKTEELVNLVTPTDTNSILVLEKVFVENDKRNFESCVVDGVLNYINNLYGIKSLFLISNHYILNSKEPFEISKKSFLYIKRSKYS